MSQIECNERVSLVCGSARHVAVQRVLPRLNFPRRNRLPIASLLMTSFRNQPTEPTASQTPHASRVQPTQTCTSILLSECVFLPGIRLCVRVSLPATTMSGSAGASCCPALVSQSLELVRVYGSALSSLCFACLPCTRR